MQSFEIELPMATMMPVGKEHIRAYLHLAAVETAAGNLEAGQPYADKAITIARRAGGRLQLAAAYAAAAGTTLNAFLVIDERSVFQVIADYCKSQGLQAPFAPIAKAVSGSRKEVLAKVDRQLQQAQSIFESEGARRELGNVQALRGRLNAAVGEKLKARECLQQALVIAVHENIW